MTESSLAPRNGTETQDTASVQKNQILGGLLFAYLHPPLGANEVSGYSWQLVTAICYEGDDLTLCE